MNCCGSHPQPSFGPLALPDQQAEEHCTEGQRGSKTGPGQVSQRRASVFEHEGRKLAERVARTHAGRHAALQAVAAGAQRGAVTTTIKALASTGALKGSTEDEQFFDQKHG